ncbi:hypothetical protein QUF54_00450 [Candidatus Marithioploca araucensis]|uniref:Uncharacterized protein n=1 Tax=Candidatus Marithioploca araucensis TaxID=70273 RepID=A0ABT7VQ59_9GAMM|nr:hypothetical protein [Candidatus Marithioploca araucensis]
MGMNLEEMRDDGRIPIFTVKLSTANGWGNEFNMMIFDKTWRVQKMRQTFIFFGLSIKHARMAGFEFVYPRHSLYSR